MASTDKEKILKKLDALKVLGNFKGKKEMRIRLEKKLRTLTPKKVKRIVSISHTQKMFKANESRSSFMKGAWRVVNLHYAKFDKTIEKRTGKKYGKMDAFKGFWSRRRGDKKLIAKDVEWTDLSP